MAGRLTVAFGSKAGGAGTDGRLTVVSESSPEAPAGAIGRRVTSGPAGAAGGASGCGGGAGARGTATGGMEGRGAVTSSSGILGAASGGCGAGAIAAAVDGGAACPPGATCGVMPRPPLVTGNTVAQTLQRARTPASGTFAGSTR
jgi:hypothetical protein